MDQRFIVHNSHHFGVDRFPIEDPHLRRLSSQPLVYRSPLLKTLPRTIPGIYMVGGGRQVGKTTVLKQWMDDLLRERHPPEAITFLTGELIDDHHQLLSHFQNQTRDPRSGSPQGSPQIWIVDEITYVKDWSKAVKFAADAGWFENTILILTGSDLSFLQEGTVLLPGRRGRASQQDFILHPLSFREFVQLKYGLIFETQFPDAQAQLEVAFDRYLMHGGFLTAINDFERFERIENSTLMIYSDWIRGDMIKRGKNEPFLKEILQAIIKHMGSQITWNTLAQSLSIDHPKTVTDYLELLMRMGCVFIQHALLEDKLTAAPKKAKKLSFADPFIYHCVTSYLREHSELAFEHSIQTIFQESEKVSKLVEAVVVNHYSRLFQTYYIKAEGEVDIAILNQNIQGPRFQPIEVKWTQQIRSKDLKQIQKYRNPLILTRLRTPFGGDQKDHTIHGIPAEHLPTHLYALGKSA